MLELNTKEQDIKLWAAFTSGNDNAFSTIFNEQAKALFRYGTKFVTDDELVKDCIQDLFVKLYKNRQNLSQTDNIRLYLFRALKNRLLDEIYSCKETVSLSSQNDPPELKSIEETEEEENSNQALRIHRLKKGMESLTPRQREAIYLRYTMEMPLDDISELLQMNYQSVKNLLHRSIEKLRKELVVSVLTIIILVCWK
jgi:RNA polymerase sigma-70 factor (ECF subfamily)